MANPIATIWNKIASLTKPVDINIRQPQGNHDAIINGIIERYNYRQRKDIASWRLALQQAENVDFPRRLLLYNLYDDIVLDNHIFSLMEHQRKEKLFSQQFRIVDIESGAIDADLTAFFYSTWFFEFMEEALWSKFYGHSLIQMGDMIQDVITGLDKLDSVTLIPRRHVVPERGLVLMEQFNMSGIPYRNAPELDYLIEVGKPKDLGILNKAAAPFITRKNALMAWSEYTEIFGMPLRTGTTPSTQQADIDRLSKALAQMGSAAYAVLRQGETVTVTPTGTGDSSGIYGGLIQVCNDDLSLLFAGQTMTHQDGSSKAQGVVHENTADDVTQADERFMAGVINDKLLPFLLTRGMNVKGKRFEYPEQTDIAMLFTQVSGFMTKYDIDPEWIEETFGIPVTMPAPPPPPAPTIIQAAPGTDPNAQPNQEAGETAKADANGVPAIEGVEAPDNLDPDKVEEAKKTLSDFAKMHIAINDLNS